jgi:hypothetical protein
VAERSAASHYGRETIEDRARLHADRANLRSAVARAIDARDATSALRFVRALGDHWHTTSQLTAGYDMACRALSLDGGNSVDRAHALHRSGRLAFELGDEAPARHNFDLAETMLAATGDRHGLWQVVQERSFYEGVLGNHEEARRYGERAVGLAGELGERDLEQLSAAVLAQVLLDAELARPAPDPAALQAIAQTHERVLAWARAEGNERHEMLVTANHGWFLLVTGDADASIELLRHALRLGVLDGMTWPAVADVVLSIGIACAYAERPHVAAQLLAAALAELGREGRPLHRSEEPYVAAAQAAARAALGPSVYEQAVRDGCELAPEDVIDMALAGGEIAFGAAIAHALDETPYE